MVSTKSTGNREAAYNYCRSLLKIWPGKGKLLEEEVRVFLKNKLGMLDGRILSFFLVFAEERRAVSYLLEDSRGRTEKES